MKNSSLPGPAGCPGMLWNPDCQPQQAQAALLRAATGRTPKIRRCLLLQWFCSALSSQHCQENEFWNVFFKLNYVLPIKEDKPFQKKISFHCSMKNCSNFIIKSPSLCLLHKYCLVWFPSALFKCHLQRIFISFIQFLSSGSLTRSNGSILRLCLQHNLQSVHTCLYHSCIFQQ